jgi:hypothetical protein
VGSVKGHIRTHKDLEWFRPLERNTIHPLFCIALERSWSTGLEEARVCEYCLRRA